MRLQSMINAVDLHCGGEPGRVIVGGVRDVPGKTMFEKMKYLETEADDLRKRMLREPRGFPAANCNLILPPTLPEADAGYVIMEQTEYPVMSGTNTICVTTALIETGMVPVEEPVTKLLLESPAGLIPVTAEVVNGKVRRVTFENQPAFAVHLDAVIEVPELGTVTVDVSYGGMFYVIADATQFGLRLTAGRRPRHRSYRRDDQGRCGGKARGRPPREPRLQRNHHRAAFGASRPPRRDRQECRHRLDRSPRLGQTLVMDGRVGSIALRHRHLRQDGGAARQRTVAVERGLPS